MLLLPACPHRTDLTEVDGRMTKMVGVDLLAPPRGESSGEEGDKEEREGVACGLQYPLTTKIVDVTTRM
jgi:hypothetical protein